MKRRIAAIGAVLALAAVMALGGVMMVADGQAQERTQEWNKGVVVPMTGAMERPEPVETNANGLAIFWLNEDMSEMCYMAYVANLTDVNQGHIHAVEGENQTGPPVVWLFPEGSTQPMVKSGETDGLLVMGTFTEEDFVGPLEGMTMADLVDMLEDQTVYVNFHTEAHPMGEIRGEFNVLNQSCDSMERTMREAMGGSSEAPAPPMPSLPY
jgi:hypothetical protein